MNRFTTIGPRMSLPTTPSARAFSVRAVVVCLCLGLSAASGGEVSPAYTAVGKPPANEITYNAAFPLLGQFGSFYAGDWDNVPGTSNFTNGQYVATRVADGFSSGAGSPLSINDITPEALVGKSDQVWSVPAGTTVSFTAIGKWSGARQQFGVYAGDGTNAKGTFQPLGPIVAGGTQPANTGYFKGGWGTFADFFSLTGGTFRWASDHQNGANYATVQTNDYTSRNADNGTANPGTHSALNGGLDRMITFLVTSVSDKSDDPDYVPHFLLFFEDGNDFDFNDLIVEVNAGSHYVPAAVPVPAMAFPAIVSLGGLGLAALRKRRG